jgi:hypothetical protein
MDRHGGGSFLTAFAAEDKKEEFTGLMDHMVPGNSFPQICVVSGVIISNVLKLHKST